MSLIKAFFYSMNGLKICIGERAFRQEMIMSAILIPAGLWLGETSVEKVLLTAPFFLLLVVELLNTAVEKTIDRISSDYHDLSKAAKDIGSAAVLVTIAMIVFIWGIILL